MNESGHQIIFTQLLDRHPFVKIPLIQRDYAQGRPKEKEVRDRFLGALHEALTVPIDDPILPLNLDFVYGSVEGIADNNFLPLDGQQRLTTLVLLHWYLAWRDDLLKEFRTIFCVPDSNGQGKARFSYSVRPSSEEFFDALMNFEPADSPSRDLPPRRLISDQPWFYRYWRLDPTIQSSLVMLDAIHERFVDEEGLFKRLCDTQNPAITFQLLDLDNFGLSDDLYIKMNARGKPLTAFETFKARYEQELGQSFRDDFRNIEGQDFPIADFVARRMDTTWSDLFWVHRDHKTNLYDSAVMNIFRVVALVTRDPGTRDTSKSAPENVRYLEDVALLRNTGQRPSYSDFDERRWLDSAFTQTLIALLEAWSSEKEGLTTLLPGTRYFDEKAVFEKLAADPTALTYAELIQFAAYTSFIREHEGDIDTQAFQEWMRIIFNLSVNSLYNEGMDFQRSVSGLRALLRNSKSILEHFADSGERIGGFSQEQIAEERLKARLILQHSGWRPLIDRAEEHGYFRGQIDFLLNFSGVIQVQNEDELNSLVEDNPKVTSTTWDNVHHLNLQSRFEFYLLRAEVTFEAAGLRDAGKHRWQRALLSIGDYLLQTGSNHSFLVNSATDPTSWKRLLRGVDNKRRFLQLLWDQLNQTVPIKDQLDQIIKNSKDLEPWRRAFIDTPSALEYCVKKLIRRISDAEIYLLKGLRMSGAHAELFTFCFHENVLRPLNAKGLLNPFIPEYISVNGTDYLPTINLMYSPRKGDLRVQIWFTHGSFNIEVDKSAAKKWPDFISELRNLQGFSIPTESTKATEIKKRVAPSQIKKSVVDLVQALTNNI